MFPLILLGDHLIFQFCLMVFSHDLRQDELSFAFVTVAADIHVCTDNVRQVKMRGKRGDHVITQR